MISAASAEVAQAAAAIPLRNTIFAIKRQWIAGHLKNDLSAILILSPVSRFTNRSPESRAYQPRQILATGRIV
jgi:hypothetical protein